MSKEDEGQAESNLALARLDLEMVLESEKFLNWSARPFTKEIGRHCTRE